MRELTQEEIRDFEKKIEELRNVEEYKYFFTEEKIKFDKVFGLGGYYATVSLEENIPNLGIIKLGSGSLNGIIQIFRKLIKEYGVVIIWRYEDNKKLEKIHNRIKNKFSFSKEIKEKNIIIIIVGGVENGRNSWKFNGWFNWNV